MSAPDKKAVVEEDLETEKAVTEATAEEPVATVVEQAAVVVESIPGNRGPPESAAVAFGSTASTAAAKLRNTASSLGSPFGRTRTFARPFDVTQLRVRSGGRLCNVTLCGVSINRN